MEENLEDPGSGNNFLDTITKMQPEKLDFIAV